MAAGRVKIGAIDLERLKEWVRPYYLRWVYFRLHPERRPPEWSVCWQFPAPRLPAPAATPGKADVLFLPMNDWHFRRQRPQQLALALGSLGHRCFYLNPHLGREFPRTVRQSATPQVRELGPRIWEIHAGLAAEPVFHHRLLTGEEEAEVARQLGEVLKSFGVRKLVLLSQFPLWNGCCEELRRRFGAVLIYDCHDLLVGLPRMARALVEAEGALFGQADRVVFTAKSLMEQKMAEVPGIGRKARVVPNGVEAGRFALAAPEPGRPVVGYVGALDAWFDCEAVATAAAAHPECDFELIGRVDDPRVRELGRLANVRLCGEVSYDEVPARMARFRVGLIPFLVNELTLATNPIKLYEYFCCGLPVVSTALPEVASFGNLVYLAGNSAEFGTKVGDALREAPGALRDERRAVAMEESWTRRAAALVEAAGD